MEKYNWWVMFSIRRSCEGWKKYETIKRVAALGEFSSRDVFITSVMIFLSPWEGES